MKKLFLAVAFLAAGVWAAATLEPVTMIDRGWQLKRGTTNVGLPHLTFDACRTQCEFSHMAYPTGQGCPDSHPVPLPEITFNIDYAVTASDDTSRWRLSSDNYSTSLPGGYSAHGDWFNGWRPDAMEAFINGCNRAALDCHSRLLGDGRAIY